MLVAAVRHRTAEVRRCMALAAAAARALLRALQSWRMTLAGCEVARLCAEELGRVYESLAERQVCYLQNPLPVIISV